ncbi:MAG: phosphatidate cytidylyltransferase [Steroidobacteraceae bacterium]
MLLQRIITAVILIVALLALLLFAPAFATVLVLTLAILAGAWEWSVFARPSALWQRVAFVALIAVLLAGAWSLRDHAHIQRAVLVGATCWWLLALLWLMLLPRLINRPIAALAGILVLVPTFIGLLQLRLDWARGAEWTLFVLILVWAADTGAFAAGKTFGKHRLAPQVSPGKTWEGCFGGVLLAGVAALCGAWWFGEPRVSFLLLCLVTAVFSVIGDLTESMFKRFAGVKDSGHMIPGHGGVMDRLDSITAAVPVFALGLQLLGDPGAMP